MSEISGRSRRTIRWPVTLLAVLSLLVAACGGTDAETTTTESETATTEAETSTTEAESTTTTEASTATTEAEVAACAVEPLEWVVHVAPGGGADVFTRQLVQIAEENELYGESINVANRPGGGGAIAYNYTAEATGNPNIIMSTTPNLVSAFVQGRSPSPVDEEAFTPLANLIFDDYVVYVNGDSEYETLDDLLEAARQAPGEITQGGGSIGASDSQAGFLIEQEAGVDFNFVSFEGGGQAQTALVGGQVDFALGQYNEGLENLRAGELRALAVLTEERLDTAPDIPTAIEQGVDVTFGIARGVYAPGQLPADRQECLVDFLRSLTESADYQDYVDQINSRPGFMTGEEYVEFMESEVTRTQNTLEAMGVIEG